MTTQRTPAHGPICQPKTTSGRPGYADDMILNLARQAMAKVVSDAREIAARQQAMEQTTSPHVIDLATALAETDDTRAQGMIADLLASGIGVRDLCLDHLAPAARELGVWWEHDTMHFADVTMAAARIQSILRKIPSDSPFATPATENRVLCAAVPGETHTLGVIMAADALRRRGWDVGLLIGMDQAEMSRHIECDERRVIGLSCAGRHSLPALSQLVEEIRRIRPDMGIVVSGRILNDSVAMENLPEVDGLVDGLRSAEAALQSVLEATASRMAAS